MRYAKHKQPAFTIVELLIVIVVIGILAAITIVAYNGIQERARTSAASSALSQAAKKLAVAMNDGTLSSFPVDQAGFEALNIHSSNSAVSYQYRPLYTGSTITGYCITATTGPTSYKITNTSQPQKGGCDGHGQGGVDPITNFVTNPSFEVDTIGWTYNSGTTMVRTTAQKYSGASSVLLTRVNTTDDFTSHTRTVTIGKTYTVSAWIYLTGTGATSNNRHFWIYNNGGAAVINVPYDTTKLNQWQRVSAQVTPTNATLQVRVHPITGAPLYLDAVMITEGQSEYVYADGSTGGWVWNGTENNATSTGLPQ